MKTSPELQKAAAEYQKGSVEAFNTLYEQSYKYLHTCVIHVVKNEDMAMDMLQETYLEISKSISQLKSTEDFLSWAAMIANRKCFAHLKKQKDVLLDGSGLGDSDGDSTDSVTDYFENIADNEEFIPETVLQDREKQRLIKEIIDGLNDMQRLCVIGFYYNEQKQEEIAEELGIPVNTVKSHLNRAKAKIKEAVVELDVKKGTRLYSFAPFMALLFREEVQACVLRPMSKGLASAVGISAGVGSVSSGVLGEFVVKVKALGAKFTAASIKTKAVVATTACAVTIGGAAVALSPEKEVVDVLSADLDIVVTENGISSELYDIDYTYSEEEQRYNYNFHFSSEEESGSVIFDTYNNGWEYSEIREDCIDGFKIGQLEFKEYIWEGKTESNSTCYVLPVDNVNYIQMTCSNLSEETINQFIKCMYELESSGNSNEYFVVKKDRMDCYLWGFGIDLGKLQNKCQNEIYYTYYFTDMCYERHLTHRIGNDWNYNNMEEFREWYKNAAESLVLELKEDYTRFNDLDWVCYTEEYNPGYFYLFQKTVMDGTEWSLNISQNGKNESIHDVYDHFMKNFNRGLNENVESIEVEEKTYDIAPGLIEAAYTVGDYLWAGDIESALKFYRMYIELENGDKIDFYHTYDPKNSRVKACEEDYYIKDTGRDYGIGFHIEYENEIAPYIYIENYENGKRSGKGYILCIWGVILEVNWVDGVPQGESKYYNCFENSIGEIKTTCMEVNVIDGLYDGEAHFTEISYIGDETFSSEYTVVYENGKSLYKKTGTDILRMNDTTLRHGIIGYANTGMIY